MTITQWEGEKYRELYESYNITRRSSMHSVGYQLPKPYQSVVAMCRGASTSNVLAAVSTATQNTSSSGHTEPWNKGLGLGSRREFFLLLYTLYIYSYRKAIIGAGIHLVISTFTTHSTETCICFLAAVPRGWIQRLW